MVDDLDARRRNRNSNKARPRPNRTARRLNVAAANSHQDRGSARRAGLTSDETLRDSLRLSARYDAPIKYHRVHQ